MQRAVILLNARLSSSANSQTRLIKGVGEAIAVNKTWRSVMSQWSIGTNDKRDDTFLSFLGNDEKATERNVLVCNSGSE